MATKTIVKNCPFCGKVCEQRSFTVWGKTIRDEDKWVYGTPYKLCPHCKKMYLDQDTRELAVTPLRRQDTAVVGVASLRLALMGVVLGIVLLLGGQNILAYIAFGVGAATLLADALLYPSRKKKLEKELAASRERMKNPDYARALQKAGFDIPASYTGGEQSTKEEMIV